VPVWIGFRPEATRLDKSLANTFAAELVRTNYLGDLEEYLLRVGDHLFKAFEQNPERLLVPGSQLSLGVAARDVLLLPRI
jgi:ABC-type Fe3+/spermidine/putrescine transport system ATPase subunit